MDMLLEIGEFANIRGPVTTIPQVVGLRPPPNGGRWGKAVEMGGAYF